MADQDKTQQQREQEQERQRQERERQQGQRRGGQEPGQVPDDTREVLENAGQQPTQTRGPDEDYEPRRTGTGREGSPNPEQGQEQPRQQ